MALDSDPSINTHYLAALYLALHPFLCAQFPSLSIKDETQGGTGTVLGIQKPPYGPRTLLSHPEKSLAFLPITACPLPLIIRGPERLAAGRKGRIDLHSSA